MTHKIVVYTDGKIWYEQEFRTDDEAKTEFRKSVRAAKKLAKLFGDGNGDTYERWVGNILIQRVTIKA